MSRILAAVLLCAASSVGCSALNGMNGGGIPSHLSRSQSAPRPAIQRASFNQPQMGVCDLECGMAGGCGDCCTGAGCGSGMCGCCDGVVDDCVSCVLDCNGGCGSACGPGGCQGGCYGGGMGQCSCGGQGRCACCMKLRSLLARGCVCGGTGQCFCCQHMKTMVGGPHAGRTDAIYNFNPGPSSAQTAYPYYTTRGPRDFFLDNPPSIGPY